MARATRFLALTILVLSVIFAAGCSKINTAGSASASQTTASDDLSKPKPVIVSVDATTSGMEDNYYAILEVTIKNTGSDGTVIVTATLTQAGQSRSSQMITNINHNTTQLLRFAFPLKWLGGDWTQNVVVSLP